MHRLSAREFSPDHPMSHFSNDWLGSLLTGLSDADLQSSDLPRQVLGFGAIQMLALAVAEPDYARFLFYLTIPLDDADTMLAGSSDWAQRHPLPEAR